MKRYIFAISLLCGLLCCSCDDDFQYYTLAIQNTSSVATSTSATVTADIVYKDKNGRVQTSISDYADGVPTIEYYGVYYSTTNSNPGKGDKKVMIENNRSYNGYERLQKVEVDLTGLTKNTSYYARVFVCNNYGEETGNVIEFTTKGSVSVKTNSATNITTSSATLNGNITKGSGSVNMTKRGFVLSTTNNPTITSCLKKWDQSSSAAGNYSTSMTGLSASTKYYYRAYAVVDGSPVYGSSVSFTTSAQQDDGITIVTNNATNITTTTATIGGTITIGTAAQGTITELGLQYRRTSASSWSKATWSSSTISSWTGSHTFTYSLSFGSYDTYEYYAYYIKGGQTYYGAIKTVTKSGGGGSTNGVNVSDFVGTYSFYGYCVDQQKYLSWDGVKIYTFDNSNTGTQWVAVEGLCYGHSFITAMGEHDATNKAIRLYSGWAFTGRTFTSSSTGDTALYARFYPVYTSTTFEPWHVIDDGAGYDGSGEGWLTFDSSGKLKFGGAATADSEGYRANGYDFGIYYKETNNWHGWLATFLEVEMTKTSNSTSSPAKVGQATGWHAPMLGDTPYKVRNSFGPIQKAR